jgi:hypothetical protein
MIARGHGLPRCTLPTRRGASAGAAAPLAPRLAEDSDREISCLSAEHEAEAARPALPVGLQPGRAERRALMSSAALARHLPSDQRNREISWRSAEHEARSRLNRARTHSRADADAIAEHNMTKRTLRTCPRPWFGSHAMPNLSASFARLEEPISHAYTKLQGAAAVAR